MNTDQLWFTTARANILLSNRDNDAGVSLVEHVMPHGFSPPLHVHHAEAETFYILDGTFRFEVDGKVAIAGAGDVMHAPARSRHSFLVMSPDGGRFLTMTTGGFEDMVREASRPAANDGLPDQAAPSPAEQRLLAEACLRNGIELLGAPLAA